MKQKQVQKKAVKKAEPSKPKKRITITPKPTVAEDFTTENFYEIFERYKPNHFRLSAMYLDLVFSHLWNGIKGLFKK